MKKRFFLPLSILLTMFFMLVSCIKEPDVVIDTPSIVSERIIWSSDGNLSVTGNYQYSTKLQSVIFYVTNQMNYESVIKSAEAVLTGENAFANTVYDLVHDSKYYYFYKLDTGYGYVYTEIKPFISSTN